MSTKKTNLAKKAAAGAVLVALSGFLPQPFVHQAMASTATINATGTFSDGITMSFLANLEFKTIVATAINGSLTVKPTGAGSIGANGFFVAAPIAGKIGFNAASVKPIDIKITSGHKVSIALTGPARWAV